MLNDRERQNQKIQKQREERIHLHKERYTYLREWMSARGITSKEMSRQLQTTCSAISSFQNGYITRRHHVRLLELGVPDELLPTPSPKSLVKGMSPQWPNPKATIEYKEEAVHDD